MARYEDRRFANEKVVLDGNEYVRCTFTDCELVYRATEVVSLDSCTFNNVAWVFDGAAARTLSFMGALYHGAGEGGQRLIEDTFNSIRRGSIPMR